LKLHEASLFAIVFLAQVFSLLISKIAFDISVAAHIHYFVQNPVFIGHSPSLQFLSHPREVSRIGKTVLAIAHLGLVVDSCPRDAILLTSRQTRTNPEDQPATKGFGEQAQN
jgi:hypothetical protein